LVAIVYLSAIEQLCPTGGPVEGFVRPSLGFRCSISSLHTDSLSIIGTKLAHEITKSHLLKQCQWLPLQLGCEHLQHISLNKIQFAKIKVSHSMCGPG